MKKRKLLFVVNTTSFFLSHRLPVALAAKQAGYEVHVATGTADPDAVLSSKGLIHHLLPMSRSGLHPIKECRDALAMWKLMKQINPKVAHLVTIKPVIYGGIAARLANIKCVVAAISGLGTVFSDNGVKKRVIRFIVSHLYRLALKHQVLKVIFQNEHDLKTLARVCHLTENQVTLIPGSGVSLKDYPYVPEPDGIPVVTFAARLIKEKGPFEFVHAAKIIKEWGLNVRFLILGAVDPGNPNSVSKSDIEVWQKEGIVEVLGHAENVADFFKLSNIICLPSYYGEGLPKVLIEAAACGRAVVTTDHPGCRDAVIDGQTGLVVPVRDAAALADAFQKLIKSESLRKNMGQAGRLLAEEKFTIENVVQQHLSIYRELSLNQQQVS